MLGIARDIVRKETGLDYEMPASHFLVGGHNLTHAEVDLSTRGEDL
jgi:hypothetical protein